MWFRWKNRGFMRAAGWALMLATGCVAAVSADLEKEGQESMEEELKTGPRNVVEERVSNLVRRMTLDEKIRYLAGTGFDFEAGLIGETQPLPRLGIPA
ncbi:MAG: hypothetical protein JXR25_10675, partial [Pontiellaceae bacterium]|nr:hypothetical protein [Pontiellaceae bacterium]